MKGDCISRKETIQWLKRVTVTDGITFETGFKQILTDIKNMPSVQPVSAIEEIKAEIIDKYISADGSLGTVAKDVLKIIDKHTSRMDKISVIYRDDGTHNPPMFEKPECPSCGYELGKLWGYPFCPKCGQALDWEDKGDE